MLKRRIVALVVIRNGIVVQSIGFKRYLPIGRPEVVVEFLDNWGIDEIILIDTSPACLMQGPNFQMIKGALKLARVPVTVGGGITNINQIHDLLHSGADKISLNNAVLHNLALVSAAACVFGEQCIVGSIDAIECKDNYRVYDHVNKVASPFSPAQHAKRMQEAGAGEILLNSVDRDGEKSGFDIRLINSVCNSVQIPVTACGGAGTKNHFIEALEKTAASAVGAGNFFHYFEHSVSILKASIFEVATIRHESYANYFNSKVDEHCRLLKKDDVFLDNLLYVKIKKEII